MLIQDGFLLKWNDSQMSSVRQNGGTPSFRVHSNYRTVRIVEKTTLVGETQV